MITPSAIALFSLVQGGLLCHDLLPRASSSPRIFATNSRPWSAPVPRPNPWPSGVASSGTPSPTITRPTNKSPSNWIATGIRSVSGVNASSPLASRACKTPHAPVGPGAFPPDERLHVVTVASSKTEDHDQPATRWSLDDLAFTIVNEAHHRAMSRSTSQRILADADLKPHQSVYWLNSHDPDFDVRAKDICQLYLQAFRLYEQGRLVISSDEKTGMQILGRKYPTPLAQPGKPEKREFEYLRHGTGALLTSFVVPTGKVVWNLGKTRTSLDWVAHLRHVRHSYPDMQGYDWVVDNLNTHWSLEVCRLVAEWCEIPLVEKELRRG